MKVEKIGGEEPEIAVVYAIHGNEVCGHYAKRQILREFNDFEKPVEFILANQKAFEKRERFIDEDLKRCFSDSDGSSYEAEVAEKLKQEVKGMKLLDLHSSLSHPEPFSIITRDNGRSKKLASETGAQRCVDLSSVYEHQIDDCNRVAVECGHLRSDQAIRNAYRITRNFLENQRAIEGEGRRSETELFSVEGTVKGSDYRFLKQNFQKVEEGEVYAANCSEVKRADEGFYPVLMSTNGYDGIIGFKAEKEKAGR